VYAEVLLKVRYMHESIPNATPHKKSNIHNNKHPHISKCLCRQHTNCPYVDSMIWCTICSCNKGLARKRVYWCMCGTNPTPYISHFYLFLQLFLFCWASFLLSKIWATWGLKNADTILLINLLYLFCRSQNRTNRPESVKQSFIYFLSVYLRYSRSQFEVDQDS